MKVLFLSMLACAALAGCGLGETAVSAAAGGASAAEQAKEGLKTEAQVKAKLDAAADLDRQQREAAEAATR
jgi:hypothetical protein